LSRENVAEEQGESRGRDTAQNCSLFGRLLIVADLPVGDADGLLDRSSMAAMVDAGATVVRSMGVLD
jgi:hypothetical protein